MSVTTQARPALVGPAAHYWQTLLWTAIVFVRRSNAYLIDVIRWPLYPLAIYATWRVGYAVAGRGEVGGVDAAGFLLIGMFGMITWTATVWGGGYALEYERYDGTIGALFLSPASRAAVIIGYGIGGLIWILPALIVVALLGVVVGARLTIADPLAALLAACALVAATLGTGFVLASLFILSRRANLMANVIQAPLQLLGGFIVPRESLPAWARLLSDALPVGHAVDALRASTLTGARLADVWWQLVLAFTLAVLYTALGLLSLWRVEDAAKRTGQLDLY